MKKLLNDLKGVNQEDIKWENMSREFLLKLVKLYSFHLMEFERQVYTQTIELNGLAKGQALFMDAYKKMRVVVDPEYLKVSGLKGDTLADWILAGLMTAELDPENSPSTLKIVAPNHLIVTVRFCKHLEWVEATHPEYVGELCNAEKEAIEIIPNCEATMIKLPPEGGRDAKRKKQDEAENSVCVWEVKRKIK